MADSDWINESVAYQRMKIMTLSINRSTYHSWIKGESDQRGLRLKLPIEEMCERKKRKSKRTAHLKKHTDAIDYDDKICKKAHFMPFIYSYCAVDVSLKRPFSPSNYANSFLGKLYQIHLNFILWLKNIFYLSKFFKITLNFQNELKKYS